MKAKEMFEKLGCTLNDECISNDVKCVDYRDQFKNDYASHYKISSDGKIALEITPYCLLDNLDKTENNIENTENNIGDNVYKKALITLLNRIDFEEFCNVCCYRDNGCDGNVKSYGGTIKFPPCADNFDSVVEDTADALANDEK
ncbi:hypothetical protein [uncultured Thomasclavelia sp.]|uniref:hypothetical protein n=1 Tax=uncultured Thomasclavelia sp. TaxID=3025759 RepID=UPI0026150713|nr:hypothetical protein [uncultured Thomasclavelia sp.]